MTQNGVGGGGLDGWRQLEMKHKTLFYLSFVLPTKLFFKFCLRFFQMLGFDHWIKKKSLIVCRVMLMSPSPMS